MFMGALRCLRLGSRLVNASRTTYSRMRRSDADTLAAVEGVGAAVADAGGAEAVAADLGFDAGVSGAATGHAVDVGLRHGPVGEATGRARVGGEEPCLGVWKCGAGSRPAFWRHSAHII